MNINGIRFKQNQLLYQLFDKNRNEKVLIESLLKGTNKAANCGKDSYIKSSTISAGTYSSLEKNKYISKNILTDINSSIYMIQYGDVIECNGNRFTVNQIPKIDGTNLKEVKAKDDLIDFGSNNYFKYISADGKEHLLYTSQKGGIGSITSEDLRGAPHDEILQRYAYFWRYMMSNDTESIYLNFTNEQVKTYLDEAGIKPGFFTVKMGDREATHFYTASKTSVVTHSKQRYDEHYASMTSSPHLFSSYVPGDVFKINGKEYVLSESHTLDIPYGEDIYNIEYPSNYYYGRRISE